jgi:hypothetical protein
MTFAVHFANGFILENEPIFGGGLVGLGCRDNYIAAPRPTRLWGK